MFDADYYGEDEGMEKPTWNEEDELEGEFSTVMWPSCGRPVSSRVSLVP